jgi:glucose-1-phosphate cytidylyltransferase
MRSQSYPRAGTLFFGEKDHITTAGSARGAIAERPVVRVLILAGGVGSHLMEERPRPKPMVEIGGKPMLWHIMKYYAAYGYREFVVALGYESEFVKRWFVDYASITSDLTVETSTGSVRRDTANDDDWTVHLVDSGQKTGTGGRVRRLRGVIGEEPFLLTWGDGVSDLDIGALVAFHRGHGRYCTMTTTRPPSRFGHLEIDGDQIIEFTEKPQVGEGWINAGCFVCEPEVFDYIPGDSTMFDEEPLSELARTGQLMAYKHYGFWQCMDTLRDRVRLEKLWEDGSPPWRIWV